MNIEEIYKEIEERTVRGSNKFYKPLDKEQSQIIREDYKSRVLISLDGSDTQEFYNKSGTLLAVGYERVVIGDYGAYVEFLPGQINDGAIKDKFYRGEAKPWQKYWWLESKDRSKTKIYEQIREVKYADYKPGLYYISPKDLYIVGEKIYLERD